MGREYKFPKNFLWGSATSAYQVEGGNINDWSKWEKENAGRLAKEAKNYWQNWQQKKFPEMFEPNNYICGRACDHYHKFEADFDIAKSLNQNAHRLSLEWSRIEPEEGKFDEEQIEHYRNVLRALKERGLEAFVTLYHWPLPLWITKKGGWENKKTINSFLIYAEKIVDELGGDIKYWIPVNEPNIYSGMAYVMGFFPPGVKNIFRANKVVKNLTQAHRKSYKLIHEKLGGKVEVGSNHNYHWHVPFNKNNPLDVLATKILYYIRDVRSSRWSKNYEDFIGLNYYYKDTVKFVLFGGKYGPFDIRNENKSVSDLGWEICPEGIYYVLKKLKKHNKPIYITENGLANADDNKREGFIKNHLIYIHKAIQESVDVRGYFYWSFLDNFEWDKGFWPRFGLVEVDYNTLERKIRPSAHKYAEICRKNKLVILGNE